MAAWRRAIELSLGETDLEKLRMIARSRTEPASRVERARILLGYWENSSFFAVGQTLGPHHQTNLAQGTLCKILDAEDVKPHKVRYYLEKRDPEFAEKMAKMLCVYRK